MNAPSMHQQIADHLIRNRGTDPNEPHEKKMRRFHRATETVVQLAPDAKDWAETDDGATAVRGESAVYVFIPKDDEVETIEVNRLPLSEMTVTQCVEANMIVNGRAGRFRGWTFACGTHRLVFATGQPLDFDPFEGSAEPFAAELARRLAWPVTG